MPLPGCIGRDASGERDQAEPSCLLAGSSGHSGPDEIEESDSDLSILHEVQVSNTKSRRAASAARQRKTGDIRAHLVSRPPGQPVSAASLPPPIDHAAVSSEASRILASIRWGFRYFCTRP